MSPTARTTLYTEKKSSVDSVTLEATDAMNALSSKNRWCSATSVLAVEVNYN